MELQVLNNSEYVITLKEITDLIGARHNDAMRKVEELSLEDGFGSLRKTRSQYESGKGRIDEIDTYIFTKKQAIAVGARLNTTMLMKVINRLEELETSKYLRPKDNITLLLESALETRKQLLAQEERLTLLENTSTIDYAQQRALQNAIASKVLECIDNYSLPMECKKQLFSNMYSKIKNTFRVGSYKDVPKIKFNDALELIETATIKVGVQ